MFLNVGAGIPLMGVNLLYTFLNNYEKQENLKSATAQSLLETTNRIIRLSTVGLTAALSYHCITYVLDESTPQYQTVLEAITHSIGLLTLGFGLLATRMYLSNIDNHLAKPLPQPPKPPTTYNPKYPPSDGWIRFD